MNSYTALNVILLSLLIGAGIYMKPSKTYCTFALRVSLLMLLMVYPWDYFGISEGSWTYPREQSTFFLVPLNDIVFMFQCNLIALAVYRPLIEPRLSLSVQTRPEAANKKS